MSVIQEPKRDPMARTVMGLLTPVSFPQPGRQNRRDEGVGLGRAPGRQGKDEVGLGRARIRGEKRIQRSGSEMELSWG